MKRVLTILAILLLPLSVWAMTPVTDSDLSNVTGQAGVNINADLLMNITIGTMAWGDSDGVAAMWNKRVYTGGFVGMTGFNLTNLRLMARAESSDNWNGYNTFSLKPISIDVATENKVAVGGASNQTFVRFGLGSLKISMDAMSFNVGTGAYVPSGTAVTINQIMGSVNMGNMQMFFKPDSYVDIFSHAGQGVNFQMSIIVDRFSMGYMSWGDIDGLNGVAHTTADTEWVGSAHTAGYVGLNNMNFGTATSYAFSIQGTAAIDVLTSRTGEYAVLNSAKKSLLNEWLNATLSLNTAQLQTYQPNESELNTFVAWMDMSNTTLAGNLANRYANMVSNVNYVSTINSMLWPLGVVPVSVVHISFPGGFIFDMGSLRSQVVVAGNANLTGTGVLGQGAGVMGDIYLQGFNVNIASGSWIDIWAH